MELDPIQEIQMDILELKKKKNLTLNSLQMFKSRLNTAKKQD